MVSERKVYTGYEVSKELNIALYVIRYYQKELGLEIKENIQGHRIYTEKDINILKEIVRLRRQKMSFKEISILIQNT